MNKGPTLLDGDLPVSSLASCEMGNGQSRKKESAERESQGASSKKCLPYIPNSLTLSQLFLLLPPLAGVFGGTGEKRRCLRRSKSLAEKDRSVGWGLRRDRARTRHVLNPKTKGHHSGGHACHREPTHSVTLQCPHCLGCHAWE